MPIKDPDKLKEARKRADEKRAGRTRNFATVVYPESAPADWKDQLDQLHVAALISPLHDQDTNPSGEQKKPHYHVLVMFEGPKDFELQVKPIFDAIGGVGRENVMSARGYARYLCHLDNPDKHQYNPADVQQFGGADYWGITQLPTDDMKMLLEIFNYIRDNAIYSLAEFIDLAGVYHPEWCSLVALSRGYIVDKYIKSLTWEQETGYVRSADRVKVDPGTGEVMEQKES